MSELNFPIVRQRRAVHIYSEVEKLRQRLALIKMEITRSKLRVKTGNAMQANVDEVIEDRYLEIERLAIG